MKEHPTLYILCGPSGCGKSTWAHQHITDHPEEDIRYVSRDEVRFNIVKENEDYFSHEKEVFQKFSGTITQTLIDGFDVIADATHLTLASRKKLTNAIDYNFKDYLITYVIFTTSLENCITNNNKRTGRENVPEQVIHKMYDQFRIPRYGEDARGHQWLYK